MRQEAPFVPKAHEIAILCRQSTGKDEQEDSNPKQLFIMAEWFQKLGLPFPEGGDNFYEAITSGLAPVRPELDRLLFDLKARRRRMVVVYHLSRPARLMLTMLEFMETLKTMKVPLGVASPRGFYDLTNHHDVFGLQVEALANEMNVMQIMSMVREGAHRKARLGYWPTAAPRGLERLQSGLLVPHKTTGVEVEDGLRAVAVLSLRSAGKVGLSEARTTLHAWSRNPAYAGNLSYANTYFEFVPDMEANYGDRPSRRRLVSPEDRKIFIPNAIISPVNQALLVELRQRLALRRNNRGGYGIRWTQRDPFCFAAITRCGLCDNPIKRRMVKGGSGKRYEYVGCAKAECANRAVHRDVWEAQVVATIQRLASSREDVVAMLTRAIQVAREALRPQAEVAKHELKALCRRKREIAIGMAKRLSSDAMVAGIYQSTLSEIGGRVALLRQAQWLKRRTLDPDEIESRCIRLRDFSAKWTSLPPLERVVLLRKSFSAITYYSPSEIEFSPQLPFLAVR